MRRPPFSSHRPNRRRRGLKLRRAAIGCGSQSGFRLSIRDWIDVLLDIVIDAPKLAWSRLPNSDDAENDVAIIGLRKKGDKGGSVESLDYEIIENYAYWEKQGTCGTEIDPPPSCRQVLAEISQGVQSSISQVFIAIIFTPQCFHFPDSHKKVLCGGIKLYVMINGTPNNDARDLLHDDISAIMGYAMSSLVDMYAHCGDIEETIMISRGFRNLDQISSVADSSFSVEIVGLFACDGDPGSAHSADCVLIYANGSGATEVPQFGKIDFGQGFSSDEMHESGFMLYRLGSMTNFATLHEVIVVNWNVSLLAACVKFGDVNSGRQFWDYIYAISFSNVTSCFQHEINMEAKLISNSIQGISLNFRYEVIFMQLSYATVLSYCAKLAYISQGKHVHAQLRLTKYGYVHDVLVEFHDQMSSHYQSKIRKYLREHLKLSVFVIQLSLMEFAYQTKLMMTLFTNFLDEVYNTGVEREELL